MNKESIKAAYDTSDSFYSSAEFGYHHKKGDYECRIILDNRQRAIDALLLNTNITKQQIEELINYIEKDADIMISQLLTEATELRQKLRTQKSSLDTVIRQLKSKVRSLSEQNLQMTSELQMKQRIHKQEISELRKYKKQERAEINYLDKEMEGMQRLLSEYQNQLQKKEKQIVWMKKQLDQQSAFSQQAKIQITKQTAQIGQLKQQIYQFEREQQTQKIISNTQQKDQIKSLLHKERMLQDEASDRECLIRCLNQEAAKKDKQIDNLNQIVANLRSELQNEKNSKAVQKNKQNSHILKLQSASEAAISSIKTKYNLKLQKIVQLVSRQLKKLRCQLQAIKTSAVKQMQLCYRQNKAIIKSELKALYSK